MIVNDLKPGDAFRTTTRQRKNFILKLVHVFKSTDQIRPEDRDKVLVIVQGCRQLLLSPTAEIYPAK